MNSIQLTVIDLECTCEQDVPINPSEIIEIGAVAGTLTLESFIVTSELQIYVRPVIHPTLTAFCTQLTGITQDTIDAAVTLPNALLTLQDWLQANSVQAWTSWGKFDSNQFARECELKSLSSPMAALQYFNLKQIFARKFKNRVGLERALELRNLTFDGTPHSGLDDSKNVGRLLFAEATLREALLKRIDAFI